MRPPETDAMPRYSNPIPNMYNIKEYGTSISVFASIYLDVRLMPITTGNMGTFACSYSSRIFMAKHQKCEGVHTNTKNPTKNPNKSSVPVAADHPAQDAALPAMPPITIFDVFSRFSQTVYIITYENIPSAMKKADTTFIRKYPYITEAQLNANP